MFDSECPSVVVRWPLVRVLEGRQTEVQLLSGDWVRLVTHFYGRTFLCPEVDECVACQLLPSRAYWYLPVLSLATKRPSILELSAHASADLEQRCRFAGWPVAPGVQVELSRRSKKAPLRMELVGRVETPPVAVACEWCTALMALFCLPALVPGETLAQYGDRVKLVVLRRAELKGREAESRVKAGVNGR